MPFFQRSSASTTSLSLPLLAGVPEISAVPEVVVAVEAVAFFPVEARARPGRAPLAANARASSDLARRGAGAAWALARPSLSRGRLRPSTECVRRTVSCDGDGAIGVKERGKGNGGRR